VALAQSSTSPFAPSGAPEQALILRTALSNAPGAFHRGLVLSNRTVNVLSKMRGTQPSAVMVKSMGTNGAGLEVAVAKTADVQAEAAALSKDFGAGATVVLDEVAADGKYCTNFVFRNGVGEKWIMPANFKDLRPGGRRILIRPAGTGPTAPKTVKVVP